MSKFWDRQGKPIDNVITWAMMVEDPEYRIVAVDSDEPGGVMVSTIWQGINFGASLRDDEPLATFETVILRPNGDGAARIEENERWFGATEEHARENHLVACRLALGREPRMDNDLKALVVQRERAARG